MPDQILIGNFGKGLKTNLIPANIDNDAFPTLFNFYVWRGRARRKRGTIYLGQLTQQIQSVAVPSVFQNGPLALVAGAANLISGFSLPVTSTITPLKISFIVGGNTYTEPSVPDGTLLKNAVVDPGSTINYATGAVTIAGGGVGPLTGTFSFYPGLPVMALEDFDPPNSNNLYPFLLAFDTLKSYQVNKTTNSVDFYNTNFYITNNPFSWSGLDYQKFWTTNYSSVLWATNNKPGLHFLSGVYVSGSGTTTITFVFKLNGVAYQTLILGDIIWFNEWTNGGVTLNKITGTISDATGSATGTYVVTFSSNQTVSGTGIIQALTNTIATLAGQTQDGIRYYTGDPTATTGLPVTNNLGWVNFAPPLTATFGGVAIAQYQQAIYYLVGALAILPFKDRLLFFSPYIQTSTGTPLQLQDTVLWSWNGTPFYAVTDQNNTPTQFAVPPNETSNQQGYYVDQTGFAGYLPAGIPQPISTISNNQDVLLIGFGGDGRKTRFVYTGNDIQPFLFFNINSELPSQSTYSAVALDQGVIDIGQYGIAMTNQQSSERVDLDIPDSVFQIQAPNNGAQRVNAIRDFQQEWIYFSYPVGNSPWRFPTQTFLFNYRDNTWAILYENFTAHGTYRPTSKKSWKTLQFKSWNAWKEPWNSGVNSPQFPNIIAGNPQGYVLIKGEGTGEGRSGTIYAISNSGGNAQITSTNHCVTYANQNTGVGDYLLFQGCLGATSLNGIVGRVISTADANTFVVDLPFPAGTYLGLGTFTRLSQPIIQTKQFPAYWQEGRQVRLSTQKYLLDATASAQVTLNINLSQDPDTAWNNPSVNVPPNSLIYTQLLFTCPESSNAGLSPANYNLQTPTAITQNQIWHRINTSLQGSTIQIGLTLSDSQMRNVSYATSEIALHAIQLAIERGPHLA